MPQIEARIDDRFDVVIVILGEIAHIFEGRQLSSRFLRNEASFFRGGCFYDLFCGTKPRLRCSLARAARHAPELLA